MRIAARLALACLLTLGSVLAGTPTGASARPAAASEAQPAAVPEASNHPGMRLLVRFAPEASDQARSRALALVGGTVDREIVALGVTRVALPGGTDDAYGDGAEIAAYLSQDSAVEWAELDASVALRFTPNDSYYTSDPFTGLGQWGIRRAQVDAAWDRARGSSNVIVAVIDTGADPGHPDLAPALLPGVAFLSQPAAGCGTSPIDDNSHGTHVAGIIGATGDNGTGIAGVAFGVRILPLKVLDCRGGGATSDIAQAIIYAVDHGARVINISLGSNSDTGTMRSAVQYAASRNVLIVASAGNCGSSSSQCSAPNETTYPAAYPEVVAVAATDTDDSRASFSTQAAYVDVAAPGRRILSTTPTYSTTQSNNGGRLTYDAYQGTSQASPFVAGLAALLFSQEATLTAAGAAERLRSTADDLGVVGVDPAFGAGRVNGLRAINAGGFGAYGAAYDTSLVPSNASPGQGFSATVRITNTSSFTWPSAGAGAVSLASRWVDANGAVLSQGAPVALASPVAPAGIVTLTTQVIAPTQGVRTLRFDLVQDGVGAFSARGVPTGDVAVLVGPGANGASYSPSAATPLTIGVPSVLNVSLANTGTLSWSAGGSLPVRLSYHWIGPGGVIVWDGARSALSSDVPPGATISVPLTVVPPSVPGTYTLRIDLVQEGVSWFSGQGIPARDVTVSVVSGYGAAYTPTIVPTLLPGGRYALPVIVRNTGSLTWPATGATPVRLAAHIVDLDGNVVSWDGERMVLSEPVAPGATVFTEVIVAAPLAAGSYRVRIDLVHEGITWFGGFGVTPGEAPLLVSADFRATVPAGPLSVSQSNAVAQVVIANTSNARWTTTGVSPVRVAAHWYGAAGQVLRWDGPRTLLPKDVAPGESVTLSVALGSPPAGAAFVAIDLVAEGQRWFGAGAPRAVTLVP